jgi:hypothetical protein
VRRAAALSGLDPVTARRHLLHAPDRIWVEKNCYIDIWIEVLHALELDPMAMLPFTVAIDFEGDQWTFFKPPHEDLRALYGIDVQEMYVWRSLLDHALEHLGAGKFISTEADAFWLPDTAGTDYRSQHTKTTIVLAEIDAVAGRLGYFHSAGFFTLEGEDFARLFRLGAPPDPTYMPLFAELVRHDRRVLRPASELRAQSRAMLAKHLGFRPKVNPIGAFQARFERDLPWMSQQGLGVFHTWAFGTLRQLGAAAELSALYLQWLEPGGGALSGAVGPFLDLSNTAKALILKFARAVNARRALDAAASFAAMADAWARCDAVLRPAP